MLSSIRTLTLDLDKIDSVQTKMALSLNADEFAELGAIEGMCFS